MSSFDLCEFDVVGEVFFWDEFYEFLGAVYNADFVVGSHAFQLSMRVSSNLGIVPLFQYAQTRLGHASLGFDYFALVLKGLESEFIGDDCFCGREGFEEEDVDEYEGCCCDEGCAGDKALLFEWDCWMWLLCW